jgi:hypothetical protein
VPRRVKGARRQALWTAYRVRLMRERALIATHARPALVVNSLAPARLLQSKLPAARASRSDLEREVETLGDRVGEAERFLADITAKLAEKKGEVVARGEFLWWRSDVKTRAGCPLSSRHVAHLLTSPAHFIPHPLFLSHLQSASWSTPTRRWRA